jgi:hypothetical protein
VVRIIEASLPRLQSQRATSIASLTTELARMWALGVGSPVTSPTHRARDCAG